jgi:hypothetical protein
MRRARCPVFSKAFAHLRECTLDLASVEAYPTLPDLSRRGPWSEAILPRELDQEIGTSAFETPNHIVPLNSEAGRGVGFRMQLLFFLDDLASSIFGKPLLSSRPTISVMKTFNSKSD